MILLFDVSESIAVPVAAEVTVSLILFAGGFFIAVLNDNRVQKMCGDPDPQPLVEAGSIWGPIFLIGLVLTVVLAVRGPVAYVQPVWLLLNRADEMGEGIIGGNKHRSDPSENRLQANVRPLDSRQGA